MAEGKRSIGGILFAVLILIAGVCTELVTVQLFFKAKEVESWPTTRGKIVRSDMTRDLNGYEARIEYVYAVAGQDLKSAQVRTRGTAGKHQSDIAPLIDKFPLGQEVTVYHNPANPADAYLEPGVDFVNYIIIISPVFFALMAAGYIVEQIRMKPGVDGPPATPAK